MKNTAMEHTSANPAAESGLSDGQPAAGSKAWFEKIKTDAVLSKQLPLACQAGLPCPFLHEGRLLLYVPFYSLQARAKGFSYTEKLCEAYFEAGTKRLVLFRDISRLKKEEIREFDKEEELSDAAIRRKALSSAQLFVMLDDMEREFARTGRADDADVQACKKALADALLAPEQAEMYEDFSL